MILRIKKIICSIIGHSEVYLERSDICTRCHRVRFSGRY